MSTIIKFNQQGNNWFLAIPVSLNYNTGLTKTVSFLGHQCSCALVNGMNCDVHLHIGTLKLAMKE